MCDRETEHISWSVYNRIDLDEYVEVGGFDGEDTGMVMLHIMQSRPDLIVDDYLDWLSMRRGRSLLAVTGLFDPSDSDRLKEDYLAFVDHVAEHVGYYRIRGSTLEIRGVDE